MIMISPQKPREQEEVAPQNQELKEKRTNGIYHLLKHPWEMKGKPKPLRWKKTKQGVIHRPALKNWLKEFLWTERKL